MNITITGKPCSGKSTVAKILVKKHNFKRIGVGDIFKAEAEKRGMSSEEFNVRCMQDPAFDNFLDDETARLGKELKGQNVIFDSRLAWHFVEESFKVFVDVSDAEMARRLSNSDREGKEKENDVEKAKKSLINRFNTENKRYQLFYGIDNLDMKNYDLVIDSTNLTADEVADKIFEEYEKHCKNRKTA